MSTLQYVSSLESKSLDRKDLYAPENIHLVLPLLPQPPLPLEQLVLLDGAWHQHWQRPASLPVSPRTQKEHWHLPVIYCYTSLCWTHGNWRLHSKGNSSKKKDHQQHPHGSHKAKEKKHLFQTLLTLTPVNCTGVMLCLFVTQTLSSLHHQYSKLLIPCVLLTVFKYTVSTTICRYWLHKHYTIHLWVWG